VGGEVVVARRVEGSPDPIRLGGISTRLAGQIETTTGIETRATILGHLQRGGTPSAFDRVLATTYGHHALELVMEGDFGKMVVWRQGRVSQVAIETVAGKQRTVPPDHWLIATARAVGTHFGA
jgi:ATP-dependent phosphofructokinase / diphosphate-dependent phosphofructokinase